MTSTDRPSRAESRGRILALLRGAGRPVGISELIRDSGLSAGAVRFHLGNLVRTGDVRPVRPATSRRRGRPPLAYETMSVGAADPAEAYRTLAALLGRELLRSGRATAAYEAGRHAARAARSPGTGSPRLAADVITGLLSEGGFDPTMRPDGRTVELNQCPFYDLAAELPGVVCAVHEGLTAGALESAGLPANVRVLPVHDGSGPCLVQLLDPSPPPAASGRATSQKEIVQ